MKIPTQLKRKTLGGKLDKLWSKLILKYDKSFMRSYTEEHFNELEPDGLPPSLLPNADEMIEFSGKG